MNDEKEKAPLLELRDVRKRFGAVKAVDGVSLSLNYGEIVALLGDNGAGKSTLCKLISGAYQTDGGEILWNGEAVKLNTPDDANDLGISMLYQDLALVDHVDVPGNVFLGEEPKKMLFGFLPILNERKMRQATLELLERIDIRIPNMDQPTARLSGGQRQATGVARILRKETAARLLIFDEPLAALAFQEEKKVRQLLQNLRGQGHAILVVTHNLEHVFALADRIAVLHTGRVAGLVKTEDATREQIVTFVMGGQWKNGKPQH